MDVFQLFFNYLEERPYNNIHQNVKSDVGSRLLGYCLPNGHAMLFFSTDTVCRLVTTDRKSAIFHDFYGLRSTADTVFYLFVLQRLLCTISSSSIRTA